VNGDEIALTDVKLNNRRPDNPNRIEIAGEGAADAVDGKMI
jgi:hypothetical protein